MMISKYRPKHRQDYKAFLHVKLRISHRYGIEDFTWEEYQQMNHRFRTGLNLSGKVRDTDGNEYAWIKVRDVWVVAYYHTHTKRVATVYPRIGPCPDETGAKQGKQDTHYVNLQHMLANAILSSKQDLINLHANMVSEKGSAGDLSLLNDKLATLAKKHRGRYKMSQMKEATLYDLFDVLNLVAELPEKQAKEAIDKTLKSMVPSDPITKTSLNVIADRVRSFMADYLSEPARIVRMISLKGKTHAATPSASKETM